MYMDQLKINSNKNQAKLELFTLKLKLNVAYFKLEMTIIDKCVEQ